MSLIKDIINPKKYIGKYKPILIVVALSVFSVSMLGANMIKTGDTNYFYLVWNLFLAWLPMFFAYLLFHRMEFPGPRLRKWKFWGMSIIWLLFFPNAPYLITDLIHINERHHPASHADSLILFSFALSGLIAGLLSLNIMHACFRARFSRRWPEVLVGISITLSGYGIYLGRVERWNSWDVIVDPYFLLSNSLENLTNPTAIGMTVGFATLIGMVYLLMLSLIKVRE